ncbi:MAG TPA: NAD(P)H-hydrate epimerase, partial [Gammaproteobacteria bacterium]
MGCLSPKLYTAAQVREMDRHAIMDHGISGYELMERAGRAAFVHLQRMLTDTGSTDTAGHKILVVCGGGNNGGDGYVIASLAKTKGYPVDIVALVPPEKLQGDALRAATVWRGLGGSTRTAGQIEFAGYHVVVDAILGTGLQRPVEGEFRSLIERINAAPCRVLAVDIPSGLNADTGQPMGVAVEAEVTVTFVGLKQGLFTGSAADYAGRIYHETLNVPNVIFEAQQPSAELIIESEVNTILPPRPRGSHKGDYGHVLIIGGDFGMAGAAYMAGSGALRAGAGLVTIATRREHAVSLGGGRPELMCHGVEAPDELEPLLRKASVVAVGPGLGRSAWGRSMLTKTLDSHHRLVLD